MSTIRVGFGNTEIDAAQALLDLCNVRDGATSSYGENRDSLETAQLFLSCLISNVASPLQKPQMAPKVGTVAPMYAVPKGNSIKTEEPIQTPVPRRSPYQEVPRAHTSAPYNQDCNKRSLFKRKPMKHFPTFRPLEAISSSKDESNRQNKKQTRDVGTQTEDLYQLPVIQTMEYTIARLCDKIKTLEAQLKPSTPCNPIGQEDSDYDQDYEDGSDESYKADSDDTSFSNSDKSFTDYATPRKSENIKKKMAATQTLKSTKVLVNRNINANADAMVPLGKGNVMIPAKIFKYINWSSYTSATRKLLTAVFSRRILATHSLTGKPSPAFPNKPAKKKLDPALVNDIVQTVIERCGVPENVVRTSITTKCADESKMYRTREENKRRGKVNRENIPPGTDSDDF